MAFERAQTPIDLVQLAEIAGKYPDRPNMLPPSTLPQNTGVADFVGYARDTGRARGGKRAAGCHDNASAGRLVPQMFSTDLATYRAKTTGGRGEALRYQQPPHLDGR
jgi:hypothetical protein